MSTQAEAKDDDVEVDPDYHNIIDQSETVKGKRNREFGDFETIAHQSQSILVGHCYLQRKEDKRDPRFW